MSEANRLPPPDVEKHNESDSAISIEVRRANISDLGYYFNGQVDFVRGMGDRAEQVQNLFFQQSEKRGIPGTSYTRGFLSMDGQIRDYLFAERDLGNEAKSTIAVRIASIGPDLYVEWHHYVRPPTQISWGCVILLTGLILIVAFYMVMLPFDLVRNTGGPYDNIVAIIGSLIVLWIVVLFVKATWKKILEISKIQLNSLSGFQTQDSVAFYFAIQAAIEEALDLAGIAKELRTTTKYEESPSDKQRRRSVI